MNDYFKAIEENNLAKLTTLISLGFEINEIDEFGYSGLQNAISNCKTEISLLLINAGIYLDYQDKKGSTALHYVAEYNSVDLAKLMLKKGASLSISDNYGNQPLWTAVFNDQGKSSHRELIKLFLENGADVNHKNNVNKSPKDIVQIAGYNNLKDLIN